MFLKTSRYCILFQGEFVEEKVRVNFDLDAKAKLTEKQREEIGRHWDEMQRKGWNMGPDPLYRLVDFSVRDDLLILSLGITDYREYMGTNVRHPEWFLEYGNEAMSNAVSVSAVTETNDGRLILERRSQNVAESRGYYHTKPSGHPHPPEGIFEGVHSQARQELGIEKSDITEISCIGLVRSAIVRKPELMFKMKLEIPSSEVERRPKRDSYEFEELLYLPKDPVFLAKWLAENFQRTVSPGHGTLLTFGFQSFGSKWLKEVGNKLDQRGKIHSLSK